MRTRAVLAALFVALGFVVLPMRAASAKPAGEAQEECIHKLEGGGSIDDCQKAPSLILPATNEIIWGGLGFVIVFFALAKFGYPAIKKGMEDRSNRIRDSLDEAERAKNEATGILDEYQRQLADARSEANRIIEEARQTADQLRRDLVSRAEQEAQEMRQRTQEDIAAAQQRAMADLQSQVRDLTIDLAEKVVGKQLDRETNRALVDGYIAELERT
ncbi:MAG TPA: F0F1 ATP synthase subunit B [Acidimicrobiales bacterium]|nr:F0F1 ATP synthase subunit B [Acidimicrobiales bacterium]